jgi:hypothetical protein
MMWYAVRDSRDGWEDCWIGRTQSPGYGQMLRPFLYETYNEAYRCLEFAAEEMFIARERLSVEGFQHIKVPPCEPRHD